ncbi:hypothetical protein LguiA_001669 [Lonicera macranthoides]
MEGGYIITHSPAFLLKERNFHLSDPYRVHIYENCSTIYNPSKHSLYYKGCKNKNDIVQASITTNEDGMTMSKVRVRSIRIPQTRDKFSSRHGQKRLISMTYAQKDMPWSVEGISLDIIFNRHFIPCRMTVI